MTESDRVLVDTNVILDVTNADPDWMDWSMRRMSQFPSRLLINPLVYSELCYHASDLAEVEMTIAILGLHYHELPREALFLTAQAYREYRGRGGVKTAPLADFFIGAHAQASRLAILTRDATRYKTYFPKVTLICP